MSNHELVTINQEIAMNTPSEEVYTKGKLIVTKTLIPLNNETSKIVYFVDDSEGHSYDSFANKEDAISYLKTLND